MGSRIVFFASAFVIGFLVLFTSVLRITSVKYAFSQSPSPTPDSHIEDINIDYKLPEPSVMPDHPMWSIQATLDRLNYYSISGSINKTDFLLNEADKRLAAGYSMILQDNFDEGIAVLVRSEQYFAKSYDKVQNAQEEEGYTDELYKLSLASLKHREILEKSLLIAPEDAKPVIVKILDTSKHVYNQTSSSLMHLNMDYPQNPF